MNEKFRSPVSIALRTLIPSLFLFPFPFPFDAMIPKQGKDLRATLTFGTGAVLLFVNSWVVPWYTSPVWLSQPAAEFEGTKWAAFGPVFMAIALTAPLALLLMFLGTLSLGKEHDHYNAMRVAVVVTVLSMLGPASTMDYHPELFAAAGGIILLSVTAGLWFWAKIHAELENKHKFASRCRVGSYLFLVMASLQLCALLGNPFSGLFHAGRTEVNPGSWPFLYAIGSRAAIYLATGIFLQCGADYFTCQALTEKQKVV
jgi:hypothetical protein